MGVCGGGAEKVKTCFYHIVLLVVDLVEKNRRCTRALFPLTNLLRANLKLSDLVRLLAICQNLHTSGVLLASLL